MTIKKIDLITKEGLFGGWVIDTDTGIYIDWIYFNRYPKSLHSYGAGISENKELLIDTIVSQFSDVYKKRETILENITSEQLANVVLPYVSAQKFNKPIKKKIEEFKKVISHIKSPVKKELCDFIKEMIL